jgi:hypothetical protein
VIKKTRGAAALRSMQLGPQGGSPNQRKISFGRIGWNSRGSKKWTHAEDGQLVSGGHAVFLNCEVWAPSWSACQGELLGPDVYFAVSGESAASSKPNDQLNFGSTCIMAVASDMGQGDQARQTAESIASTLEAMLRAHCVRPWSRSVGDGALHQNAINDLVVVGLFKPGPRHRAPVSLSSLAGAWTLF